VIWRFSPQYSIVLLETTISYSKTILISEERIMTSLFNFRCRKEAIVYSKVYYQNYNAKT
jgi:hypothetical protein